jgi:hypothetical protein
MYPHFSAGDASAFVEKARKAGYRIIQEPRTYNWARKPSSLTLMVTRGRLCPLPSDHSRHPQADRRHRPLWAANFGYTLPRCAWLQDSLLLLIRQ